MSREGGQVRAAEAGRRGSVGHVEVFRMDGVGTSIVGRPRRLSADRRARPTYTVIWEEPAMLRNPVRSPLKQLGVLRSANGNSTRNHSARWVRTAKSWPQMTI